MIPNITLAEYQGLALRTAAPGIRKDMKYSMGGLGGEAGELLGCVMAYSLCTNLPERMKLHSSIALEAGDLLWGMVQAMEAWDISPMLISALSRTHSPVLGVDLKLLSVVVVTDALALVDLTKKMLYHHPDAQKQEDLRNMYQSNMVEALAHLRDLVGLLGLTLEQVMQKNLDKLAKRYGTSFNTVGAFAKDRE